MSYKIEMVAEGKVLHPNKFRNHHSHSAKYESKNKLSDMVDYLEDLGLTMASADAFTILQKRFQLNKKQFYYLRGKLTKNTSFG
jgi:spore coat polysaccharide biosynthesis protein SpsF (cytidylyltransferase family)